jgi:hypothetical protein
VIRFRSDLGMNFLETINQNKWIVAGGAIALISVFWLFPSGNTTEQATFTAIRGPMSIDVIEGGTIEATEAQVIKSRVEGRDGTTILKIVEEGYQVTENDVADKMVLVELDSSAI